MPKVTPVAARDRTGFKLRTLNWALSVDNCPPSAVVPRAATASPGCLLEMQFWHARIKKILN